jgi:NADH:ubiquinone oxidoreductase subunit E
MPSPDMQRARLLGLLKESQRESGYISEDATISISESLGISVGEVYGVASFYAFLFRKPRGKHVIRVCKSLPCYIKDAPMIMESVKSKIGIGPGETTPDGLFTFEWTNCIGACDQAPAMLIDDRVYGNLTPYKISEVLDSYE